MTEEQLHEYHPRKKLTPKQHISLSAFWCGFNVIWGSLLGIVMPKIVQDIVGPVQKASVLGNTLGAGAIIALTLPLIVGGLSDRCKSRWGRRRPYIFVGTIIAISGLFMMYESSVVHSVGLFIASYVVIEIGQNIANAAYSGVMPDIVPLNQRGMASGYMALMSQIGTLIGIGGSGFLMGVNYGYAFLLMSSMLALSVLITMIGVKEKQQTGDIEPINWPTYLKSLWISPKKYPDFFWVWITRFSVMLGFYSVQPYLQYYLKEVIHVENPVQTMGQFGIIVLLSAMVSGITGGHISDKVGRKKVVYIANSIIAAVSLTFIFLRTLEQVFFVAILFGFGYGAYISVDWALGTSVLPTKTNAAKEMAVWHIAMTLPQMIGIPFAGWLLSSFGTTKIGDTVGYTLEGYSAMFLTASVFFILGALGLRNVKSAH